MTMDSLLAIIIIAYFIAIGFFLYKGIKKYRNVTLLKYILRQLCGLCIMVSLALSSFFSVSAYITIPLTSVGLAILVVEMFIKDRTPALNER